MWTRLQNCLFFIFFSLTAFAKQSEGSLSLPAPNLCEILSRTVPPALLGEALAQRYKKPLDFIFSGLAALPSFEKTQKAVDEIDQWVTSALYDPRQIWQVVSKAFHVPLAPHGNEDLITPQGPLAVIADHNYGLADSLYLAEFIERVRPGEVKILTNGLASELIRDSGRFLIEVEVYAPQSPLGKRKNLRAMVQARKWLEDGHVLIFYPSGALSKTGSFFSKEVIEAPWKANMARLLLGTEGTRILPVHFTSTASRAFYALEHIHSTFKFGMMFRETFLSEKRGMSAVVGKSIPASLLAFKSDPQAQIDALRAYTLDLKSGDRDQYTFFTDQILRAYLRQRGSNAMLPALRKSPAASPFSEAELAAILASIGADPVRLENLLKGIEGPSTVIPEIQLVF